MIAKLEEIKRILHFDWDPIGVAGIPMALDEYDSYAFQVLVMLNKGADAQSIADYLDWVVTERMGLPQLRNSGEIAARIMKNHLGHANI
jgi:hypothetical protein